METTTAPRSEPRPATHATAIDLCTSAQALETLAIGEDALIGLINGGTLAAYRLGDDLRFRRSELLALRQHAAVT